RGVGRKPDRLLGARTRFRRYRSLERVDDRPDPVPLLLDQTTEADCAGSAVILQCEPLASLVLDRRHDQRLNRAFARTPIEREKEPVKSTSDFGSGPALGRERAVAQFFLLDETDV